MKCTRFLNNFTKFKHNSNFFNFRFSTRLLTTNEKGSDNASPIINFLSVSQTVLTFTDVGDNTTFVDLKHDFSPIQNLLEPETQFYGFYFDYLPNDTNLLSIYLDPACVISNPSVVYQGYQTVVRQQKNFNLTKQRNRGLDLHGFNSEYFALSVITDEAHHIIDSSISTSFLLTHGISSQRFPIMCRLEENDKTFNIVEDVKKAKCPMITSTGFGVDFAQHEFCVDIVRYKPAPECVDSKILKQSSEGNEVEGVAVLIAIKPNYSFEDFGEVVPKPSTTIHGLNILVGKEPFQLDSKFVFDA
jgi:hypothetical protein